jgi:phosphonate transport system ATP-binding protein
MSGSEPLLDVRNLEMRWPATGHHALRGVNLSVHAGELAVVLGANGSGKSTFLKCIVRLLTPTAGTIVVDGNDLARLSGRVLRGARLSVALVSQHANLVKRRSVLANVASGALGRYDDLGTKCGFIPRPALPAAYEHLRTVGLLPLAAQRAGTLSGGQAQRVAIARALSQNPRVLLADEPVASLDPDAAEEILALLRRLAREDGLAVLAVLHQPDLTLRYADRVFGFRNGTVAFDLPASQVTMQLVATLYGSDAAA